METQKREQAMSIAKTFGLPEVDHSLLTSGFKDETHPLIPPVDKHYVFRREILRDILAFLENPRGDGLFFSGDFGCGKTSLPIQVAAKLNWPVLTSDGSEEFNVDDLIGRPDLQQGTGVFQYGTLTTAMKYGYVFVFNEIDTVPPGRLTAVHDVLEGRPLVIHANGGEVIKPHVNFRFIATGNSLGSGDTTGLYQGVNVLNIAFMDRFRLIKVEYPQASTELAILQKLTPEIPEKIREKMVKAANEVRRLFVGESTTGDALTITISTRTLCRWASLVLDYRNSPKPLEYALRVALTNKAEPEQKIAIEELVQTVFGDDWELKL